jgi:plastocyanin
MRSIRFRNDLGSYPKGQTRKVTFNRAGTIDIECAIHPEMRMQVEVAE